MNTTLQPIPELDNLTDDQREQLHAWIEELGYRKTMTKLAEEWGLQITYNKLYRYYQRALQAREFDDLVEHQITVPNLLAPLNGHPVPYDQAGLALIQKRAFELACKSHITPAKLASLQRILHYNKTCAWTERRLAQNDQRIAISNRLAAVKEAQLVVRLASAKPKAGPEGSTNLEPRSQVKSDHLGPLARTPADLRARAEKKFGLQPLATAPQPSAPERPKQNSASSVTHQSPPAASFSLSPQGERAGERGPSPSQTNPTINPETHEHDHPISPINHREP